MMRISRFEIENYRSIRKAAVDDITNLTTFIGPNNEGKSNILKAIRMALSAFEDIQFFQMNSSRVRYNRFGSPDERPSFHWSTDYPLDLQEKTFPKDKRTKIKINFQLDTEECGVFYNKFGLSINGNVPIVIYFGKRELEIDVVKQGRAKPSFKKYERQIAKFLSERLRFVYIPAVRTAETAQEIINAIVARRMDAAERDVMRQIEASMKKTQKRAVQEIQSELEETLKAFLPQMKTLKLSVDNFPLRRLHRRNFHVILDDGTATPIHMKGDGVQSLAVLALMRASEREGLSANLIFAIEEPEAHLHSDAVYKVRQVIKDSANENQILLSTHSSIFVNQSNLSSNIIVRESEATPANALEEIRECLGVRTPENLKTAEVVFFVEGKHDTDLWIEIFERDTDLRGRLESGSVRIISLDGVKNLEGQAKFFASINCEVWGFLDGDNEASDAFAGAEARGFINRENFSTSVSEGRNQSECEDMFSTHSYESVLKKHKLQVDDEFHKGGAKNLSGKMLSLWNRL